MKLHKGSKGFYFTILGICCAVFIACAVCISFYFFHSNNFKSEIDELNSNIVYAGDSDLDYVHHDLARLSALNGDCKGWLSIPMTNISYPVMQNADDSEFYLNHNFKREKNKHGLPFLADDVNINSRSDASLIYAHYMQDGTLFGPLLDFEDVVFAEEHNSIILETESGAFLYRIFTAFKTTADENGFDYYNYIKYDNEHVYNEFLERTSQLALYQIGKTPSYGDEILMLSTCEYSAKNGRFVLVAVLDKKI